MPTPARSTIFLCPVGEYDSKQVRLEVLKDFVERYFCLPCKLVSIAERYQGSGLGQLADSSNDHQRASAPMILNSSRVKAALAETKASLDDAFILLGVTLHTVTESGFIALGEACQRRRVGFANIRGSGSLRVALSVVAHELGHLFQLEHCVYFECVMNGA